MGIIMVMRTITVMPTLMHMIIIITITPTITRITTIPTGRSRRNWKARTGSGAG